MTQYYSVESGPAKRLIGMGIWVLALAGGLYLMGLSASDALLLGATAVIAYGLRRLPYTDQPDWPERFDDQADQGTRREVARLSWNLQGHEHRVERSSVQRLRRLAERRLAERGLRLSDPADGAACRAALAEPAYAILTGPEHTTRPTLSDFGRAVAAVEHLRTGRPGDVLAAAWAGPRR